MKLKRSTRRKHKNFQSQPAIRIALTGNPNCGKTTLFNILTGSNQHIGNWPGVTVSLKTGRYKNNKSIEIVDLPGIYGLSPLSLDEVVTRDYIINEKPDLILNVVDATNLERGLYLTSELMALDAKIVIALNMCDEAEKLGMIIDEKKLAEHFSCDVIKISAKKRKGLDEMMSACSDITGMHKKWLEFSDDIELLIDHIDKHVQLENNRRFQLIKLLECDKKAFSDLGLSKELSEHIIQDVGEIEKARDNDIVSVIATQRYDILHRYVNESVQYVKKRTVSDRIDAVVTNKWLAFPIFALIMWGIFFISIQSIGSLTIGGMEWLVERLQEAVSGGLVSVAAPLWIHSLLVDGIIAGVGAVIVYIPQIMILFGLISLLEACGYMARVAYIMDALFSKIGLSGKSFIPMIIGCGCSVPAIMGARTIKNPLERDATIMLVPFIPCSAKLPIFSFFTTMIFGGNALAATSMYFIGIAVVILGGLFLKLITRKTRQEKDAFVMELPPYRIPAAKNVLRDMWDRGKAFLVKAGTIIFLASIILWVLQSFSFTFKMVEPDQSMLASIGKVLAPIFRPLGWGDWRLVVATLTGSVAKETVVTTMEILNVTSSMFTQASAYSFMVFNLLFFPCIAALSASFRELSSTKLGFAAMAFQAVTAYTVSLVCYGMGLLYSRYNPIFWSVICVGIVVIAAAIALTTLIKRRKKYSCNSNCAVCAFRQECSKVQKDSAVNADDIDKHI